MIRLQASQKRYFPTRHLRAYYSSSPARPAELRAVARHLFRDGWSALSSHLDGPDGHRGCVSLASAAVPHSTAPGISQDLQHVPHGTAPGIPQDLRQKRLLQHSPAGNFARCARSSSVVPEGPALQSQGCCCASLTSAYSCSSRSCCAKRFPASLAAAAVPFPLHQEVPSCGRRHRARCDPRSAPQACCVPALHSSCLGNKKWAWLWVSLKVTP